MMHRSHDKAESPKKFLRRKLRGMAPDYLAKTIEQGMIFICKYLVDNAQRFCWTT